MVGMLKFSVSLELIEFSVIDNTNSINVVLRTLRRKVKGASVCVL